ncbi:MAG: NAD(P)H-hydrate dehydratase, partial [Anaerolineaceae bacterium]|nr:NAD(P)H-hydrate dehydratase [Anaerolineaceae bacterium]
LNAVRDGIQNASSVVIGPGWGLSDQNCDFLNKLLGTIPKKTPLVIDADGLKLLARLKNWFTLLPEQTILTPHPGEMGVLTGLEVAEVQANRWQLAQEYAKRWDVALVLKGAMTVIASPQASLFVNPVSDAALATAGSGDVLTGLIGGFLAQGVSPIQANVLGVWVHAEAGILARKTLGMGQSVTALDILNHIPEALLKTKKAGF